MHASPRLRDLPSLLRRVAAAAGDVPALRFHAWHLHDLEREAFQVRIARLLAERAPVLADFDGDAIATARRYVDRPPGPALAGFAAARAATLAMLARIAPRDALRSGSQDGVGFVMLAHLPERMLDHDRSHALEVANLVEGDAGAELHRWAMGIAATATTPCNQERVPGIAGRRDGIGATRVRSCPGPALHRVQRAIVAALPGGEVTTRRLCDALAVSPRTLQRRLADRGLTVACLVDETRRALALDRLCGGAPLPQIAAELGFADHRSLGRAFKRWTGERLTHARDHRCGSGT